MQEQIIIDGVDVAECANLLYSYYPEQHKSYEICKNAFIKNRCCENPNCYYKQLQHKAKECERYYNEWIKCSTELDVYKQIEQQMQEKHFDLTMENDKLKEELTALEQTNAACEKEYKRVLTLAKQNADSYEYCIQSLEKENEELKIQVSGLTNRYSELLNKYNDLKGVSENVEGKKLRRIFEEYGAINQSRKLQEECAELIRAIARQDLNNMLEEMADVLVLIEQFETVEKYKTRIDEIRKQKIERTLMKVEQFNY